MEEDREVVELYCHWCDGYVRFTLELLLDGNHVVDCPKCGHEHCRVVRNGRITGDRWDHRNPTYPVPRSLVNYCVTSASTTAGDFYLSASWLNCTSA